jgi:hypothetical protein
MFGEQAPEVIYGDLLFTVIDVAFLRQVNLDLFRLTGSLIEMPGLSTKVVEIMKKINRRKTTSTIGVRSILGSSRCLR